MRRWGYAFSRKWTGSSTIRASWTSIGQGDLPHQNWRGAYDIGTFAEGLSKTDDLDARCKRTGTLTSPEIWLCVTVRWPASNTSFFGMQYSAHTSGEAWMGGQIDGRRDASGLQYMRNRYHDPQTARFTQEDPIGLGGGFNLYGFAAGDPVTYSDPYGLKIYCDEQANVAGQSGCELYEELRMAVNNGLRSDDRRVRAGARRLAQLLNAMHADEDRHYLVIAGKLADDTGGGIEEPIPGRENWWVATIDPSQSADNPNQQVSASLWILVAHELGGARARSLGGSHPSGSIPAENGARMIVGCRKRWWHGGDTPLTHPGCYR